MSGALNGITVLDLTRVLAGPWATMTLADLGADVIKIEPPEGDETRFWGPPFAGEVSSYFACVNRNKRSIVLDLRTEQDIARLHHMVQKADVVVENFRTGVAERLRCDEKTLRALKPDLIYCSISGYGRTGVGKDLPGYDLLIQSEAGLMSITGEADGAPHKVGVAVVDVTTGMNAVQAILAALFRRERTGQGECIDIALYDTQLQWLANVASNTLFSGDDAKRYGNAHPSIVPYQSFQAADGAFTVCVGNQKQWRQLCALLNKEAWLTDPYFHDNPARVAHRATLVSELEQIFQTQPRHVWVEGLRARGVPAGIVQSVKEALESPITKSRHMQVTLTDRQGAAIPMLASPLKLREAPPAYHRAPPTLGEHTQDILRAFGLEDTPPEAKTEATTGTS